MKQVTQGDTLESGATQSHRSLLLILPADFLDDPALIKVVLAFTVVDFKEQQLKHAIPPGSTP